MSFGKLLGRKAADCEQQANANGLIPKGIYYAVLDGYEEIYTRNGNTRHKLTFKILSGIYAGRTVQGSLFDTERMAAIIPVTAHRLGLLRVNERGEYEEIPGKTSFHAAIGTAVFIAVTHSTMKSADGQDHTFAQLEVNPIVPMNDKRAIDCAAKLGIKIEQKPAQQTPPFGSSAAKPTVDEIDV